MYRVTACHMGSHKPGRSGRGLGPHKRRGQRKLAGQHSLPVSRAPGSSPCSLPCTLTLPLNPAPHPVPSTLHLTLRPQPCPITLHSTRAWTPGCWLQSLHSRACSPGPGRRYKCKVALRREGTPELSGVASASIRDNSAPDTHGLTRPVCGTIHRERFDGSAHRALRW